MEKVKTIIALSHSYHGIRAGTVLVIKVPDNRRWKKLIHKLLFRSPPMIDKRVVVTAISGNSVTV